MAGRPVRLLQWLLLVGRVPLLLLVGRHRTVLQSRLLLLCLKLHVRLLRLGPAILLSARSRPLLLLMPLVRVRRPVLLGWVGCPSAMLLPKGPMLLVVRRRGTILLLHGRPWLWILLLLLRWRLLHRWPLLLLALLHRRPWLLMLHTMQRRTIVLLLRLLHAGWQRLAPLRCCTVSRASAGWLAAPRGHLLIELWVADRRRLRLQHLQAQHHDEPARGAR